MPPTLAYRLFLDPLPVNGTAWSLLLVVPLVVLIAIAYKTIKLHDLRQVPRQAATLATQVLVFLTAAAALLWLLTWWA